MKDRENVAAVGNACTPPQQRLPPPGFSAVVPCSSTPATDTRAWLERQLRQANETMAPIVQVHQRGESIALTRDLPCRCNRPRRRSRQQPPVIPSTCLQDRGQFAALLQRVERVLPGDHVLQGRVANMRARAHPAPAEVRARDRLAPPASALQSAVCHAVRANTEHCAAHPCQLPPPGYVKQATVYFEPGAPDQVVLAHERQPCQQVRQGGAVGRTGSAGTCGLLLDSPAFRRPKSLTRPQVLLPEEPLEQPEAAAEVQPGAEERGAPGGAPARPLQHKVDRLMGDAEPQEGEEQVRGGHVWPASLPEPQQALPPAPAELPEQPASFPPAPPCTPAGGRGS